MSGKKVLQHTFKKKNQAVTLATSAVRVNEETVQINPQLLFQRLVTAGTRTDQLPDIFRFELCSHPPSLFESRYVMRPANKPALADAIWALMPGDVVVAMGKSPYVFIDGGSLLHRIPWQRGSTYNDICNMYTRYVTKKYERAIVVFDGYEEELSTKDSTHRRRTGGQVGPTVYFSSDMVMKSKKETFLSNNINKQRFIGLLSERLEEVGCETHHATGDADVLIVQTAVRAAANSQTILVGDDTDLLVLLCFHVQEDSCDIFFKPEVKTGTKTPRYWNIKAVQR
jgi:hypothetical protein